MSYSKGGYVFKKGFVSTYFTVINIFINLQQTT